MRSLSLPSDLLDMHAPEYRKALKAFTVYDRDVEIGTLAAIGAIQAQNMAFELLGGNLDPFVRRGRLRAIRRVKYDGMCGKPGWIEGLAPDAPR